MFSKSVTSESEHKYVGFEQNGQNRVKLPFNNSFV